MSEDPVTREDVKKVAKEFATPTFSWGLLVLVYGMLLQMIEKQGMMGQPYIPEAVTATSAAVVVFTLIMIFCWGFVLHLYLQYLIDRGESQ